MLSVTPVTRAGPTAKLDGKANMPWPVSEKRAPVESVIDHAPSLPESLMREFGAMMPGWREAAWITGREAHVPCDFAFRSDFDNPGGVGEADESIAVRHRLHAAGDQVIEC